jgi:hypothetical protein
MARSKGHLSLLLLSAVVASLVASSSAGIYHIVGAGKGWRIAPNRTYYEEWARTRNISIGDKLSKPIHQQFLFHLLLRLLCRRPAILDIIDRRRSPSAWVNVVFLYRSGVYNIVEVPSKDLFVGCSMRNITNRYQNGPTIIELTQPGPRYYFCGVGKHCEEGQKLTINVSAVAQQSRVDDLAASSSSHATAAHRLLCLAACLLASALSMLM